MEDKKQLRLSTSRRHQHSLFTPMVVFLMQLMSKPEGRIFQKAGI